MGTIAGTLSHFSGFIFLSGTSIFNEPAWWTLIHPKLTPQGISFICKKLEYIKDGHIHTLLIVDSKLLTQKQTAKMNKEKVPPEAELYESILHSSINNEEYLQLFNVNNSQISAEISDDNSSVILSKVNTLLNVYVW